MSSTIWHNPACGTSRNTLAMLRAAGEVPSVIEYLKTPPSRAELVAAFAAAGLTARQAMRTKGTPAAELGLQAPDITDEAILNAMLAHPILINRPIVVTPMGARLCRPSQTVLDILPNPAIGMFTKEDGEVVPGRPRSEPTAPDLSAAV
jgi:arsenate reductase